MASFSNNIYMPDKVTLIGIVAGVCTSISLLPQLIKIIKTKKAEDISYVMLIFLFLGVGAWVWYGMEKNDYPIIITNSFSFLVNILVIIFTARYRDKSEKKE
jgi:MtN3 and saliva related transmembrane protein